VDHFNSLMAEFLGQKPKPKVRKCRHGSFYTEGHEDGFELLRCTRCSASFRFDGVRKTRIKP
jgi:hypothetical protein